MSTLVWAFRLASVAVFAAPLVLRLIGPRHGATIRARHGAAARAPVLVNIAAFALFFATLVLYRAGSEGEAALILGAAGLLLAMAGATVIVWSRMELGAAWSLVPVADEATGLVTTGPYRVVRHPIYLGFFMLTAGEGLAFASWPALAVLLAGIVPTLLWRARREETLLQRTFGERYERYRQDTRMIIPYLL